MNRLKKVISVLLCGVTIGCSMASCAKTTVSTEIISSLFTDLSKVSYSMDYTQLKDNKTNKENSWRQARRNTTKRERQVGNNDLNVGVRVWCPATECRDLLQAVLPMRILLSIKICISLCLTIIPVIVP